MRLVSRVPEDPLVPAGFSGGRRECNEGIFYNMPYLVEMRACGGDPRVVHKNFNNLTALTFKFNNIRKRFGEVHLDFHMRDNKANQVLSEIICLFWMNQQSATRLSPSLYRRSRGTPVRWVQIFIAINRGVDTECSEDHCAVWNIESPAYQIHFSNPQVLAWNSTKIEQFKGLLWNSSLFC